MIWMDKKSLRITEKSELSSICICCFSLTLLVYLLRNLAAKQPDHYSWHSFI